MKQVAFIGFGEIGGALAGLMKPHAEIRAWDKDPAKVMGGVHSMDEAIDGTDAVFLCVPSWVIRQVAEEMRDKLPPKAVVISLAKGLEAVTLKTMDVVLREALRPHQPSGVMGGPLLAEELNEGLPGVGVIGAEDQFVFETIAPLFFGTALRLEYKSDSSAVALSSVLKNIYAVALGMSDGLGWGWNAKGWLAARGLQEMSDIVAQLKGDLDVTRGPAGAGDFLATALSPGSFNRETGRQIALTGECKTLSEGCRSIISILELLGSVRPNLPILFSLDQIINQHAPVKTVFQQLLSSDQTA